MANVKLNFHDSCQEYWVCTIKSIRSPVISINVFTKVTFREIIVKTSHCYLYGKQSSIFNNLNNYNFFFVFILDFIY